MSPTFPDCFFGKLRQCNDRRPANQGNLSQSLSDNLLSGISARLSEDNDGGCGRAANDREGECCSEDGGEREHGRTPMMIGGLSRALAERG